MIWLEISKWIGYNQKKLFTKRSTGMKKYSLIIFCFIVFSMFQVVWAEDNIMEEASTLGNKEIVTQTENKGEGSKLEIKDEKLPLDFYEAKSSVENQVTEQNMTSVAEEKKSTASKKEESKKATTQKVIVNNKGYLQFIAKKNPKLSAQQRELIASSVEKAAKKYNVRSSMIMAVMWKESTFQPNTKTGPCHGLMQLHHSYCGLSKSEIYDIEKNILQGTRELSSNLKKYGGNEVMALTAYNVGVGNVARGNYQTVYAKNVLAKEQNIIAFARK